MNRYLLAALIAPLVWGTTYGVTQRWLPGVEPLWLAALRSLLPGLLLLPWALRADWARNWRNLFILSLFNLVFFTVLLFVAIQRLPGGVAATLVSTVPLQVLLLLWLRGQRPSLASMLASIAGIGGVALLVWQAPAQLDWLGVIAALLGATSLAVGGLLTKRLAGQMSPLVLSAAQFLCSGVLLTVLAWPLTGTLPTLGSSQWLALIWIGPVGLGLGYYCWFYAMGGIAIERLAFVGLMNPVIAVVLGLYLLNEHLVLNQLLAIALVLGSVLFAQSPGFRRKPLTKAGTESASAGA